MRDIEEIHRALAPTLEKLEENRQTYRSRCRKYTLILILPIIALFTAAVLSKAWALGSVGAGLWLVIGAILYHVRAGSLGKAYCLEYKRKVIPPLIATIDPQLAYHPESGVSSSSFVRTELFTDSPDRYRTEDLIQGKYGNTFLRLAEINAEERRTRRNSKGNRETYYVTIFDGLLLIADFHKHFHGRTFVFPDTAEKMFGNFGRFFQKMGGRSDTNLIRLEDPGFENAFAVYATDEIEARYILSTAMMRRILEMRERFGSDIRIGFKDSNLVLAVPHANSYLEPDKGRPATDPGQVRGMLFELKYFLDTIEELDLNTRIWTKK